MKQYEKENEPVVHFRTPDRSIEINFENEDYLDDQISNGNISARLTAVHLKEGCFLASKVHASQVTTFRCNFKQKDFVHFLFNLQGNIKCSIGEKEFTVPENRFIMFQDPHYNEFCLEIKANISTKFSLLSCLTDHLCNQLHQFIDSERGEKDFLRYAAHFDMKIVDTHLLLFRNEYEPDVRKYFLTGIGYKIFSLYILQIKKDLENLSEPSLSARKITALKNAQQLIQKNLSNHYTIPEISREVGMSPAQLQNCFREVFGQTVNEFIRETKINQSKIFLAEKDTLISEVI